jgi:hypothetical protein
MQTALIMQTVSIMLGPRLPARAAQLIGVRGTCRRGWTTSRRRESGLRVRGRNDEDHDERDRSL